MANYSGELKKEEHRIKLQWGGSFFNSFLLADEKK
jgi:hypothetical protein